MPLVHKWDDWDPYPLIAPTDADVEEQLSRISDFGKLVFSTGCAEWVVWRFADHVKDERALQFIDACWAYELSPNFEVPEELDDEEWEGPVLGPICLALTTILNTRYGFDERNAEVDAAFAEQVVLHVLPDRTLYLRWRDQVIERLLTIAPADRSNPPGPRLPRAVLDPKVPIDESALDVLLEPALRGLQLEGNPFVTKVGDEEDED
jgi:hypothetical protein